MERPQSERTSEAPKQRALNRLVVKNTVYLTASQAITIPLAVVVNAVSARYLGAADFGTLYLAVTVCDFGFLAVNWGHEGTLAALIAQDKPSAGALLASSVAWRLTMGCIVYGILAVGCRLFGYSASFQWVLALCCLVATLGAVLTAAKDTVRGFERADIPAYVHVGQQFLNALFVIPALVLGGRIRTALIAQAIPYVIVLALMWPAVRSFELGSLAVRRKALRTLFVGGTPFVFFGLAMALQPNIDALYLSKMASVEVIGWYAVSRRLIGVLLFPAAALINSLYPTLSRLWVEEKSEFARVSRGALQGVALLTAPVALGCALYPEIGIAVFNTKAFRPAEDNLRVLSLFVLLVYFTMPLGTCVMAASKQRPWSAVQCICVVVSLVLDPLLIPWFQRRFGNGGLGVSVASVVSELLVLVCGLALLPRGILDRSFAKTIALAALAGAVMALVAHVLHPILTTYLAAPVAVGSYFGVLIATGGIDKQLVGVVSGFIQRKLSRAR
jgi:O-antigen/teichoic acid export membrane protein